MDDFDFDSEMDDEIAEFKIAGLKIEVPSEILSKKTSRMLKKGRYATNERSGTRRSLTEMDRVLDLGSGIGLISLLAGRIVGPENVVCVEANDDLLQIISSNHQLNGMEDIQIFHGAVTEKSSKTVQLHMGDEFGDSTIVGAQENTVSSKEVPALGLASLISDHSPTVIVCTIGGAELHLFDKVDLKDVRQIVVELHKDIYGLEGIHHFFKTMDKQGFVFDPNTSSRSVAGFSKMKERDD